MSNQNGNFVPGLQGVIAAETSLSSVDGQKGELIIAGFPVEVLAGAATHEEVIYLLWHDRLPTGDELADFQNQIATQRPIAPATIALLRAAAAEQLPVMDALRMGAATLDLQREPDLSGEQIAQAIVARWQPAFWTTWARSRANCRCSSLPYPLYGRSVLGRV
jgi:citrate synthase